MEKNPDEAQEEIVKWSAASLYSGGADTVGARFFIATRPHI